MLITVAPCVLDKVGVFDVDGTRGSAVESVRDGVSVSVAEKNRETETVPVTVGDAVRGRRLSVGDAVGDTVVVSADDGVTLGETLALAPVDTVADGVFGGEAVAL